MLRVPSSVFAAALIVAATAGCPGPAGSDDAGSPRVIAPLPVVDGGRETFPDSGPRVDAGAAPVDAGTPPVDAGALNDGGTPADAGPTADAGDDAGVLADAGPGFDAGTFLCPGDDVIGGRVGAPSDVSTVSPTDTLRICTGAGGADVFTVSVAAGERLRITAATAGYADGETILVGTEPDLDLFLLSTPPVINGEGDIDGLVLDSAFTADAWERMATDLDVGGTYYIVVIAFAGPPVDYTLALQRETSCRTDADCTGGDETCQLAIDVDLLRVLSTCEKWAPLSCGVGVEEGGADNHSDTAAYPLLAPVGATSCPGDVDVFSLSANVGDTLVVDVNAPAIPLNEFLIVTMVDPRGVVTTWFPAYLQEPKLQLREVLVEHAGDWFVYVEHFAPGAAAPVATCVAASSPTSEGSSARARLTPVMPAARTTPTTP